GITLFYFNDVPTEEIGLIMELTQTNVKVRLHRLRKKLLSQLQLLIEKNNKEIFQ
ncbi:MAG: RNA polymerase subunit sigma, partial [Bacteroidetes bacterium]|nr:RNA polymerase subunit sigma [Bacteroidota bacterium]